MLDGVVNIAVKPTRSLTILVFLSVWSTALVIGALFMVGSLFVQGHASLWLLLPVGFVAMMTVVPVSLLRWNARGEEHVEVSTKRVRYFRVYHPVSNLDVSYDDARAFELGHPSQQGRGQFDFQIWRMGAWSLRLVTASGRKVEFVKRLTKHDAELIRAALRSVGYSVLGAEEPP